MDPRVYTDPADPVARQINIDTASLGRSLILISNTSLLKSYHQGMYRHSRVSRKNKDQKQFWILDFRFWIKPHSSRSGHSDFRFWILSELARKTGYKFDPGSSSVIQNNLFCLNERKNPGDILEGNPCAGLPELFMSGISCDHSNSTNTGR